ncbi:3542_t:CDS:2 [Entrophospora sp. SA101]|nr:3542_t:CDS:2 [Entrophospora sp. SA101]
MAIPIETNNPEASNLHINISKSTRNNVSRLISSFKNNKIRISLRVLLAIVKPEIHQLIIDSMMTHNNTDNPEDSSDEDERRLH